jgi:hypothetical protein
MAETIAAAFPCRWAASGQSGYLHLWYRRDAKLGEDLPENLKLLCNELPHQSRSRAQEERRRQALFLAKKDLAHDLAPCVTASRSRRQKEGPDERT